MRTLPLIKALDRHRDALAACRACGHVGVLPVVAYAREPQVMLVGQAPGQTEAVNRRPFSGRAGKTLFRWLERAGVNEETARDRIYISAVTRCYPGPSPSGRGDRVPSVAEQEACGRWLRDELRIIRPKLLIPVGRLAIDRFLPKRALGELIGREHRVERDGWSTVAIPLPHPSGASSWIHMPGNSALLDRALELLRVRLGDLLYF
jgi:uracil-DNA glycosylase